MAASLNAIVMLAFIAITGVACATMCRQRPGGRRIAHSLVGGAILFVLGATSFAHGCAAGSPLVQPLVCSVCLAAVWLFVTSGVARLTATVTIIAGGIALCTQFNTIVHQPGYTGNPRATDRSAQTQLDLARGLVGRLEDATVYPAGWLAHQPFASADEALRQLVAGAHLSEPAPLWHTWLTGIHRLRRSRHELWFPGGTPAEGAARLGWRCR